MLNSNTNSKLHHQMKQQKIRKSVSVFNFKTLPAGQIVFNPNEFIVGESKIERLPERFISRRNSLATLPRTQKPFQAKQPKQVELSLLLKINKKLSKQNSELKKQLQVYKEISCSNSSRGKSSYLEESSRGEQNLKNIVVQKINRTKCSSRPVSDNQTGLYSSKQVSCNNEFESINQIYENFCGKSIVPTVALFQEQLNKFFRQIEGTFFKLKFLFEGISRQQQVRNATEYGKCQGVLECINDICHAKIQKQKFSKGQSLAQKGKSRCKVERQPTRQKYLQKEEVLELMSPDEVIERFQKYIQKVMKSQKIIKSLKSNLIVRKLTKKLSEV